jgi:NADH dehydrogenase FAD-containing subunit
VTKVKNPAASGGALKTHQKQIQLQKLIWAAGIEPATQIAHASPPQAAGHPERFS